MFEFCPYVDPESKDAAADSEDSVEEGELEEMKVDDGASNEGLLFNHQTSWQRHLLNRYGNELSLLDVTYRTTKHPLPLYFLVVKTNVEYKVMALFVTQLETTDSVERLCLSLGSGILIGPQNTSWLIMLTKRFWEWKIFSQVPLT